MPHIETESLEPEGLYWARRNSAGPVEVVQVSTVFGREKEFLTVATLGSDEHYALEDFEFVAEITPPRF
ncbi:hypothetical protein DTW90_31750 [Neorhizobium sp. P12A]|uniref:hypothetical protein n=1 Tax=Neorhizobium sp. P12A TaxID=2268027 RepID=UPI0011EFA106|nr:hypothetical protein [Neorhizobium sp. P12A]KAA0689464.1 hypothetical protein DTW90_31750 [Neorhizobium sp. P12A]